MSAVREAPRSRTAIPRIGTGPLHQALATSEKTAALHSFCQATGTRPEEVSSDGTSLDVLRVFDAMRTRGYEVSKPQCPQHQPKKGFTAWWVHVRKANVEFALGFYTANQP